MKRLFPLFLLVVLYVALPMVYADYESLWVDSYVDNRLGWFVSGSPPYLDDTVSYIYNKINDQTEGDYGFSDLSSGGTITSVTLYLECYADDGASNDNFDVYVYDGSSWTNEGNIAPSTTGWGTYETLDLSTKLNTDTKVNNAQIYVLYHKQGGADEVYIRRGYLYVDYTPTPAGQEYSREVSQGLTVTSDSERTWTLSRSLTQTMTTATLVSRTWSTSRTFTQGLSLASDSSRSWSLSRVLTQSLTISSNAFSDIFKAFSRYLTLGLSVSSDSSRTWSLSRTVSQGMSLASDSLRSWSLSRTLTQSMSFASSLFSQLTDGGGTEFIRNIALSLSLTTDSMRTWGLSRTMNQGLSFISNAYGQKLLGELIKRFVSLDLKLNPLLAVSTTIVNEFDFLLIFAMVCTIGYFAMNDERKIYFGGFAFILWFFSAGAELASSSVNYELAFLYGAFALVMIIFILMDRAKNFGMTDFWKS